MKCMKNLICILLSVILIFSLPGLAAFAEGQSQPVPSGSSLSFSVTADENEESAMSVYSGYIGKTLRRKDGFVGIVTNVTTTENDTYLTVHVTGGNDAGRETKIQLSFILKNRNVYTVSNE